MRKWFACLAMVATAPVFAESPDSPITDRFHLRGAWFNASYATEVRIDPGAAQPGTELDAEDDLGLDDHDDQARIELMFRLGERNRIRMDFLKLERSGDAVLDRQVIFGDEVFQPGEAVASTLDLRMLTFNWTYSFVKHERFELGAGVGVHLIETEARAEVSAGFQSEDVSEAGWLPGLALDVAWRISPRVTLAARGQHFTADEREFRGSFADYHAGLQYRMRPNLAFGAGYTSIDIDLDVTDAADSGRFALRARGPELFFRVSY